jgi:hypothetical protein
MRSASIHFIIVLLVTALVMPPTVVFAEKTFPEGKDPQANMAYMAGDAIIARPLGIVATAVGFCFFVIASPFALATHSAGDAWDGLVVYPATFTFKRPMGDFN